jgi:hypothetical protein
MTKFEARMTKEAKMSKLEMTSPLAFGVDSRMPASRGGDGLVAAKQSFTRAIGDEAVPAPFSDPPCIAFCHLCFGIPSDFDIQISLAGQ